MSSCVVFRRRDQQFERVGMARNQQSVQRQRRLDVQRLGGAATSKMPFGSLTPRVSRPSGCWIDSSVMLRGILCGSAGAVLTGAAACAGRGADPPFQAPRRRRPPPLPS